MSTNYGFFKRNGVTSKTPKRISIGAGTVYKDLKYENGSWSGTILGATSGGNKFEITNEQQDVGNDLDGVHVKVKGLMIKQGETATMEVNVAELSDDIVKTAIIGTEDTSTTVDGFSVLKTKDTIEEDDYLGNIAFVGFTTENKPILIIMENAICTSGLSVNPKDKTTSVATLTFECTAEINDDGDNYDVLPVTVYMPTEE